MSLIDIQIQSQQNYTDCFNFDEMNILLAKDDYIEKRCGEIFMSHCKVLLFFCSECKEKFPSYEEFFNHLCEQHVSLEDELKYEPKDEDLLDVEYYDDDNLIVVMDNDQEDEDDDVKPIITSTSPKDAIAKEVLSQDTISQDYDISQDEDELSIDILQCYEDIEEYDAATQVESEDENRKETFLNDFSKFLEKDYRDIAECELKQENESTESTAANLQPNDDPFDLDSLTEDARCFECKQCDRVFDTRLNLRDHAKTHAKDRRYKCHVCGFAFTQQFNLRSHLKRHNGQKPFPCNQCDKRFITKNELKAHVRIHTGERPYICEICGNGFVTSGSLNEHRKRHNNIRPHKCTYCEKSFFDTGLLREHIVVHTGERAHVCDICEASFTRRKALLQHLKLHSAVKQYKCTYCDKAFAQKPGLASHLKTHRNVNALDKTEEVYVDILECVL
ncbi:zinc finger protein 287-like [Episyrphus balteatus]|uniref:zinc finger protein 287-like n=1 Tax=Episyrphus balteatus TaxID=286459 RepID=UPI002485BDF1|nr:zinc finger protein 287-like [Episyrphus balteatus]